MPTTHPVPSFPDEKTASRLRSVLLSAGYDEGTLRRALDLPAHESLFRTHELVFRESLKGHSPALRTLFELFIANETVSEETLGAALCEHTRADLRVSGLLVPVEGGERGTVRLVPMGDLLLAADLPERHRGREADVVPGPGGPTRALIRFSLPQAVDSVLDLGCGPGALALAARGWAPRVVATDINPRALAFTRFNAELNGLDGVECREGSLFQPVAGERFHQILCNPPYAISPARTFLYRDGEEDMVRTILREAPGFLAEGGTLQMMAEWPEPREGDWREGIREWCRDVEADVFVLRLYSQKNPTHALSWLVQEYGGNEIPPEIFREWMDFLEEAGAGSVGGGHIVVRRSGVGPRRREIRGISVSPDGPLGGALLRWIKGGDLAESLSHEEILDLPLAPSPDLERVDIREPGEEGWTSPSPRLRLRSGLRFGAGVDPVAAAVVERLDGQRTPREAVAAFCQSHGLPEAMFLNGLPKALRTLLRLGLLTSPPGNGMVDEP